MYKSSDFLSFDPHVQAEAIWLHPICQNDPFYDLHVHEKCI